MTAARVHYPIEWRETPEGLAPFVKDETGQEIQAVWAPQYGSQHAFLSATSIFEVLYEGNRGPGKTDALLMDFLQHVGKGYGAEWRGVIFRETFPQLADVIAKSRKWFRLIFPGARYNQQDHRWDFPTGEVLYFRHMRTEDDYWNFHGHNFTWIGWEELCNWADDKCYKVMMSLCRSTKVGIPRCYRATTNPYGCVPYGEVLTPDRGWVDIATMRAGDAVISVRPDGSAFNTVCSGVVHAPYDGEILRRKGAGLSMLFTPEHRFPLLNTKRSSHEVRHYAELPGQAVVRRTAKGWEGTHVETLEGFDAGDFMELLGWYLSEGCKIRRTGGKIESFSIAQSKPTTRARIESLLQRMGVHYRKDFQSFTLSDARIRSVFSAQGYCREKYIPREFLALAAPLLARLFESLMLGDGSGSIYYTTSKQLADDVAELATKLGYSVHTSNRQRSNREGLSYQVNTSRRDTVQLLTGNHRYDVKTTLKTLNVERIPYKGDVHCLTVPGSETFFVRQDGTVWLSGNSGHNWVKARFQLPQKRGRIIYGKTGEPPRVAIQGRLEENKILLHSDPDYVNKIIAAARNPSELAAWLEGSWDIIAGGMLDDLWKADIHIVPSFPLTMIPRRWKIDRAYDHGSSKPFACAWFAESNGEPFEYKGRIYGRVPGDLYMVQEWYGWNGTRNEGLRMLAVDIADGIKDREDDWGIAGRVRPGPADSAIFDDDNGSCVARDMASRGVKWESSLKGPGSRTKGWDAIRKMLKGALPPIGGGPREMPGFFITDVCTQAAELLPAMPRDHKNLDDVDTKSEDHIGDMVRYRIRRKENTGGQSDM